MLQHRMKFATALTVVILIFLLATPTAASKAPVWIVTALPTHGSWFGCFGNDVNATGYIGGGWIDADGGTHAAYWRNGSYHDLEQEIGLPAGQTGGTSNVLSINNSGLMGGRATGAGGRVAMLWDVRHATWRDMHPGADYVASVIRGVNSRGDATGMAVRLVDPVDPGSYLPQPYLWPKHDDGTELPIGTGVGGYGHGVNASGAVAGSYWPPADYLHAAIWSKDGSGEYALTDLHALLDDDTIIQSEAFDVDENGRVVGIALGFGPTGLFFYSWTWQANQGFEILDDVVNQVSRMSFVYKASGNFIAGSVGVVGVSDSDPAVWVRGDLEVLPDLATYEISEASSVNRSGLVVGYSFDELDLDFEYPQGWYAEKR